MTYDELGMAIRSGDRVKCEIASQKQNVIRMLYEMGFPCSSKMVNTMENVSCADMHFPYVGLNSRGKVDGFYESAVKGRRIIPAYVALAAEDTLLDIGDVMSLLT